MNCAVEKVIRLYVTIIVTILDFSEAGFAVFAIKHWVWFAMIQNYCEGWLSTWKKQMQKNLELSLDYILRDEGGFALRKEEPGGAVNKGISFLVFQEWRKRQGKPAPTIDDLRSLTDTEAKAIYTDIFANGIGFDDLPTGADYIVLNAAVMQGVRGALDLYKLSNKDPAIMLFLQSVAKLKSPSVGKFGRGWADRLVRVKDRYLSMK